MNVPIIIGSMLFITHTIIVAMVMPAKFAEKTPKTSSDTLPRTAMSANGREGSKLRSR